MGEIRAGGDASKSNGHFYFLKIAAGGTPPAV